MATSEYCAYLDKEMSIMGILSGFSISVLGGVWWKLADASEGNKSLLWRVVSNGHATVVLASALSLIAALCFYRQRSLLAFYYGQIAIATGHPNVAASGADALVAEADSWETWIFYRWGFVCLTLAFVGYGLAFTLGYIELPEWFWPLGSYGLLVLLGLGGMWRVDWLLRKAASDDSNPVTLRTFVGMKPTRAET